MTRIPEPVRVRYARCWTERQDPEAPRAGLGARHIADRLLERGVGLARIDHRLREVDRVYAEAVGSGAVWRIWAAAGAV